MVKKVTRLTNIDYETYREIMGELLNPITAPGLDPDTVKRLYESKMVYLENLRSKCFYEMNSDKPDSQFTLKDYRLILEAMRQTKLYLRELMIIAICENISRRKVV